MLFILIFTLCGCKNLGVNNKVINKSGIYFDTLINITIYGIEDETIMDKCLSMCSDYEKMFSRTLENSEVSRINKASGEPVKVSKETIEVIKAGIQYSELSDGLFDITIAPVTELWDFHENSNKVIPDSSDLEEAISHVSYKNIKIDYDESTVQLLDSKAEIDLGGIAKGYIADMLKEYLISQGVKSAIINLGGNIETIGLKPDNTPFRIGIKKPFDENELLDEVLLNNKSVSSSGVYERYFYKDDILYHHIIDPRNGYPVESDLYGVSIICDSSMEADALGTICVLLGYEKGSKLIDSLDGVEAIWAFAE